MRFFLGNAAAGPNPLPAGDGWQESPVLGATRIQNYGFLVACAGMLLVATLLRGMISPSNIWVALAVLAFTVPLHELIHALATPSWGLTDHTVIGLQREKGLLLPYMYYDGMQPLWHFLFTGVTPLLVLTVLPLLLIILAPLEDSLRADLGFLAFFNIAISGGDLVNFFWVLARVPTRSTVLWNGWGLLWKIETGRRT